MNGIPHVVHLRSFSLFGLSDLRTPGTEKESSSGCRRLPCLRVLHRRWERIGAPSARSIFSRSKARTRITT
jgi:hypothetical protein